MNLEKLSFEAPYVTTPQMVEVDRAMIEDFKIELIQMMENAGRWRQRRRCTGRRAAIAQLGGVGRGDSGPAAIGHVRNSGTSARNRSTHGHLGHGCLCRGKSRSGDRHSRWTDRLWPEGPAARCRGRAYPLGKRAERAHSGA